MKAVSFSIFLILFVNSVSIAQVKTISFVKADSLLTTKDYAKVSILIDEKSDKKNVGIQSKRIVKNNRELKIYKDSSGVFYLPKGAHEIQIIIDSALVAYFSKEVDLTESRDTIIRLTSKEISNLEVKIFVNQVSNIDTLFWTSASSTCQILTQDTLKIYCNELGKEIIDWIWHHNDTKERRTLVLEDTLKRELVKIEEGMIYLKGYKIKFCNGNGTVHSLKINSFKKWRMETNCYTERFIHLRRKIFRNK